MILQNKFKVDVQQNELLWKSIFGLTTNKFEQEKVVDIVTIEDHQTDEEILGVESGAIDDVKHQSLHGSFKLGR